MQTEIGIRCQALLVAATMLWTVVAFADPPAVKPSPATPVSVTNTSANPVPVSGAVTVTGTSNVNVTNTNIPVTVTGTSNVNVTNASIPVTGSVAASQSGSWNVGITGTPSVAISGPVSVVSAAVAAKFKSDFIVAAAGTLQTTSLAGTINMSSIVIHTFGDVNGFVLALGAEDRLTLFGGPGDVVVPLPLAIPIDTVKLRCGSSNCEVWFSIAGF